MASRLDITPGEGIGPIQLGMQPSKVLILFPESQLYEEWMGGNLNDALLFHGLRLQFDSCNAWGPLPGSRLDFITIHDREDAYLFDRPMGDWTKESLLRELRQRDFELETPSKSEIDVPKQIGFGFDEDGRLNWVEISAWSVS
jgi:hypothetical protein